MALEVTRREQEEVSILQLMTSPASAAPASPCASTWVPAALTTNGAFRYTNVRQSHLVMPERMPAVLNLVLY